MTPRVVAFAYEADVHCVNCAFERFGARLWIAGYGADMPEDNEGNRIQPIFSTDEHGTLICGDCLGEVE